MQRIYGDRSFVLSVQNRLQVHTVSARILVICYLSVRQRDGRTLRTKDIRAYYFLKNKIFILTFLYDTSLGVISEGKLGARKIA